MILSKKKRYLQIALNSTLDDASSIIEQLPQSDRIILEVGTPLIKQYGMEAVRNIFNWFNNEGVDAVPYIVADLKTMDRAETEVKMVKQAGASAAICLGQAPVETIQKFIESCKANQIDSMVDMMNVEYPITILRKLKKQPDVVILHKGVDEETFNKDKPIPYVQINKVLSSFNVLISIAGGDTIREVQRAIFNGANIAVVWKEFYHLTGSTGQLATEFLKEIK
ncbi:MAG: orotidine 5'-phosphate decarboxylase / HUMPS family protein [bacterium]|nr:orotidine 5'-phosphate decarboxylase / HUMPS family protein [bacterium]